MIIIKVISEKRVINKENVFNVKKSSFFTNNSFESINIVYFCVYKKSTYFLTINFDNKCWSINFSKSLKLSQIFDFISHIFIHFGKFTCLKNYLYKNISLTI